MSIRRARKALCTAIGVAAAGACLGAARPNIIFLFAPTLLALAGLPIPGNMDGADLMRLYDSPGSEIHRALSLINVWGHAATHALGVVTRDMKYIYWGYAADGFEVTEELYHLGTDPLELTNQAGNPEYSQVMEQMRKTYDEQVAHWKAEAVPYNNYQPYGTIFDRTVVWSEKALLLPKPQGRKKK